MYYDNLINPPHLTDGKGAKDRTPSESSVLNESSQILWETLEKFGDGWINASVLKKRMLKKDPTFNEHNYGFEQFKDFLDANSDLVETRHISPVKMEARKKPTNGSAEDRTLPMKKLHIYLACLARRKVHMPPSEHRKTLIINLYDIIKENTGISLTEALDRLTTLTKEKEPSIRYAIIKDTAFQLFHCQCFDFTSKKDYPEGTMLWDKAVTFSDGINSDNELLTWCDRELLKKIQQGLDPEEKIDPEIAAHLLYDKEGNPYKTDYVKKMIKEIETQN
jgi:hypothetical protein